MADNEMKSVKQIPKQKWMTAASTIKIMDALGQGEALFVGGCVRNALLGIEVTDIDIATKHHPEKVIEILEGQNIKVVPTGITYGTVTAVIDKKGFEITTLRKDVETDGRRAVVAYADSWAEDAQRRDFTMNTLLMDQEGRIFDPIEQGVRDLKAGKVRFVGDAKQRIDEDVLRILRFFRFHALYGQDVPEDNGVKACAQAADKIRTLSKERITQEFLKILSVDNPVDVLGIMFEHNVLKEFNFGENTLENLKHLCTFQNNYGLGFIASRLFMLANLNQQNVSSMEALLLLPKVFKKDIQAIDNILRLDDLSNDHAVKVAVYKFGRVTTAQALMIELATDRVMNGYAPTAIDIIQNWDIPNFPITGEDLIKEGIPQGPELGEELEKRENEWIGNGFCLN